MSDLKLGQLVTDERLQRDAIHIAVVPVVAAHSLRPGTAVGIHTDGEATMLVTPHVGIVDPFLTEVVRPGERFLLVMYPGTTKALRHEWEHTSFPVAETRALALALLEDGKKTEEPEEEDDGCSGMGCGA